MLSTIRLFRAVPITIKRRKKADKELLEKTISKGFVFAPEVIHNYSDKDELIGLVESIVGISPEELNSSFHKSWEKVKSASMEQLVLEQVIHYFTTYGLELFEAYDEDSVYIPNEKLEIPELKDDIKLTIIKGYTKYGLKVKLLQLLGSGIALGEETTDDAMDVARFVGLGESDIGKIKNKEVRVMMYLRLNVIPRDPVEFLRFLVYMATENALLIKSAKVINLIKARENENVDLIPIFKYYDKNFSLRGLSKIFYRYKPIFLTFRTNKELRKLVNKIRRLAKKYHEPMPEDYLNSVTAKIKSGKGVIKSELEKELIKVNVFRKIRLAHALKFRTQRTRSILYRIRNGKGYATKFKFTQGVLAKQVLKTVLDLIVKDISKNVKGKKIYIPKNISYALPSTEKQFTGNFPSGTFVSIPKDMIVGVHWEDVGKSRIDLDLSLISPDSGKIGWDAEYRSASRDILFSGDITAAPSGATELFYVRKQKKDAFLLVLNYFNHNEEIEVPFKIIVAKESVKNLNENYMVNPNNLISVVKSNINQKQKVLGLLITTTNECRFYFTETHLGQSITSSDTEFSEHARKYLLNFYEKSIRLVDVLIEAGAEIVDKKEICDIDLSPENLEKDSIVLLIS